jgi:hypothetical protein
VTPGCSAYVDVLCRRWCCDSSGRKIGVCGWMCCGNWTNPRVWKCVCNRVLSVLVYMYMQKGLRTVTVRAKLEFVAPCLCRSGVYPYVGRRGIPLRRQGGKELRKTASFNCFLLDCRVVDEWMFTLLQV